MSTPSRPDNLCRVRVVRMILEALALGLLIGFLTDHFDCEPAPSLRDGLASTASAFQLLLNASLGGNPAGVGDHAPAGRPGTTMYAAAAVAPGATLAATGGPDVTLFDSKGAVLHRWRVPVEALFTAPALMRAEDVTIDGYQVLPDGSLLAIVVAEMVFPAFRWDDVTMNSILVKLDAQSHLDWAYSESPHHDLVAVGSGEVYVLVARDGVTPKGDGTLLPPRFRDEGIAVLNSAGREEKTIWLSEAIARSSYAELLAMLDLGWDGCLRSEHYCWDLFHANSVEVISVEIASKLSFAKSGDLLVNLRAQDTVVVIDPVTGAVRWALHGSWHHAHDAHFTAAGTLMLFDNLGNVGGAEPSRIVEIDPATGATLWQYDGGHRHPFFSSIRGTAQALANGNVLITESMGGRIFEITHRGDLAWEYVSPIAKGADAAPVIWGGRRVDLADYPFLRDCADRNCRADTKQARGTEGAPLTP